MAKWTSIDRYPEKTGQYLGCFSIDDRDEYYMDVIIFFDGSTYDEVHGICQDDVDLEYGPGFYTQSVDEFNDKWVFCEYNNAFVAWMPLPEPPNEIQTNIFDEEETYPNCTVQILKNSVTGETSVGWWENK